MLEDFGEMRERDCVCQKEGTLGGEYGVCTSRRAAQPPGLTFEPESEKERQLQADIERTASTEHSGSSAPQADPLRPRDKVEHRVREKNSPLQCGNECSFGAMRTPENTAPLWFSDRSGRGNGGMLGTRADTTVLTAPELQRRWRHQVHQLGRSWLTIIELTYFKTCVLVSYCWEANYHKLSGFKQRTFVLSFCESRVWALSRTHCLVSHGYNRSISWGCNLY